MSYSKQFLAYILLQYVLASLIMHYINPFTEYASTLRLIILVGAPVWQFCILIASLGILNTLNWNGNTLVVASVIVETVIVAVIITIVNKWFGGNQSLPITLVMTTAFAAALANSALAYIIIVWLGESFGDLMGYVTFGGWAFAQWLFTSLILSGVESSYVKSEDIAMLSFASIFIQMILCLFLYAIIRKILPKVQSKKSTYSILLLLACIAWGAFFAIIGQNLALFSLGFPMSMFIVPIFSSSNGLPVVNVSM